MASALVKAISAARLYPIDNPTYLNAKSNFDEAMTSVLTLKRQIRFVVGRKTLFYAGEPVLSEEHGESVATYLHRDGIREMTFHQGFTQEEAADLLHLFTHAATAERSQSEDFATLFWDRGFEHVACVAIDDFLDAQGEEDEIPDEFGMNFIPQIDLEVYELEDEQAIERASREMSEKALARLAENDAELFGVSQEEREKLLAELKEEEDPKRMRHDYTRILVEVLLAERDAAEFERLIEVFESHMGTLLAHGNLEDISWLISVLHRLKTERGEVEDEETPLIDRALNWIWQEEQRDILLQKLDRGDLDTLQGLPALVGAIPDDTIRHLCLLLGDIESGRVRRRLIDLLVERCKTSWTALLPILSDSRWYLVRNIVLILGQVGNRVIAPSLHRVVKHSDHRVRKEALIALDKLDPGRAVSDLKDALRDSESRVRVVAAQTLAKRGSEAAGTLLQVVSEKEFAGRSEEETLAIYYALAHAGGNEVYEFFERSTKPRGLFRKGPTEESRAAACRALGKMNDPRALRLAEKLVQDKTGLVRDAAFAAMREARDRADGRSTSESGREAA
ncbi:MAG: HEAT repeat domain-containing protein [Candidatus Eisenbacteria bacterium]